MPRQYHIQCSNGDVGGYGLLPGDPGRCEAIASHLHAARLVASNREYTTWTGTLAGQPVSVASTGIGGPSAAVAVEELAAVGMHTFVRVGTCGAIQPTVHKGDLVVATGAVRDEGTTLQYAPVAFPAIASRQVVDALIRTITDTDTKFHTGVVHSKDAFYAQTKPGSVPIATELLERWGVWERAGVLASEMECAALFVVASVRRLRAGAVLLCVNEPPYTEDHSGIEELPLGALIRSAVSSLEALITMDLTANHRAEV